MFKTARMLKFRTIIPQQASDATVARLHEAGVVQLKEISELEVMRKALGEEVFEVSSLIAKFREIQDFLRAQQYGEPIRVGELTYGQVLRSARKLLNEVEPKLDILRAKSRELDERKQELLAQKEIVGYFREVKLPLQYLRSTGEVHIAVGQIAEERLQEFAKSTTEALAGKVFISSIGRGKRRTVIVACRMRDQPKLMPMLYRYEVDILELPPLAEVPSEASRAIEEKLRRAEKEKAQIDRQVRKLARARAREINCLTELLEIQKERLGCGAIFGYTDATALIEGWVPAKKVSEFDGIVAEASRKRYIFRTYEPQRAELEATPVELENPQPIKNFEYVTEMYGLPKYDEVDPTPILSITFAIFFAICLSDAGYGIVLGAFMLSNFWVAKMFPKELKRMMVMCAAFTIIAGFMMGGWFGDALKNVHPFFGAHWVDPVENPVPLLKLAIFIGIIHLILAFGLIGLLKSLFRRDWKGLIFKNLSGTLIVIGFFGLGFCILGIGLMDFGIDFRFPRVELTEAFNPFAFQDGLLAALKAVFYAGLGLGILGVLLTAEGIGGKLGGSMNVVYGIIGLIADVTSYSRLMALGIATGVIAFIINYIIRFAYASIFPKELSVLSALFAMVLLIGFAFIFIAGHCFNIFINTLGGFIHTMRLHFAEFFGKFYESGGEKFSPFKAKRAFTILKGGG